jgi:hypoxanthine phosphoribosyltransferase
MRSGEFATSGEGMKELPSVVIAEEELRQRVRELGAEISRDYADRTPVLVSVLKGSFIFLADLVRSITIPVNVDFMAITRYGAGKRGGVVRIEKDLDLAITGRDVLFVEDIVDTGLTLGYLVRNLQAREPAGLAVCTLLDRHARRLVNLPIRYRGFEVPDLFLVGYGLDHLERYRNLPYLGALPDDEKGSAPAVGSPAIRPVRATLSPAEGGADHD